jgi:hypothetical protein|tara:strand:- start:1707 stop:2129 length:423 start_codon:yes stop_codon:yes gene_type:complete
MPEGVTYTKRSEAAAYAKKVGGTVVPVKRNGITGFNVIEQQQPGRDEGVTGQTYEGSSVNSSTGATSGPTTVLRNMGGMMQDMPGYMGGGMMQDMPGYMGGGMMDETLGYTRGGMTEEKRGPIKYSKGGAIKGKNFKGSY